MLSMYTDNGTAGGGVQDIVVVIFDFWRRK